MTLKPTTASRKAWAAVLVAAFITGISDATGPGVVLGMALGLLLVYVVPVVVVGRTRRFVDERRAE